MDTKTEKPEILSAKTEKPISKMTKTVKPKTPGQCPLITICDNARLPLTLPSPLCNGKTILGLHLMSSKF